MIKKSIFFLLFTLVYNVGFTQAEPPKLVVGIVVDQMRADYIYRYYDKLSNSGFKRLLNDGFNYQNAHFNYVPTYTGPGHASIYTGTTPSRHGIIGNNWFEKETGKSVYCAGDETVTAVGGSGENGEVSPRRMLTTTVTDELRLFSNHRSKVIGVAIKDRGSALPAGHNPTGAYWYDDKSGDFITSTYYRDELPKWVRDFNKKGLAKKYAGLTWEPLLDISEYTESTTDNTPYEYAVQGETPTLPYDLSKTESGLSALKSTPFGNTLTLDMALAAIEGESLGDDNFTDFLAVSFSSTDYVGHGFGVRAIETEDTYLRLDKEIARLLEFLDENIGEKEYTLFLTADHGVADVPAYSKDNNYPGGRLNVKEKSGDLMKAIQGKLGEGQWVIDLSNDQIHLNKALIEEKGRSLSEVQSIIKEIMMQSGFIEEAFTATELGSRQMTDPIAIKLQNGYHMRMSGDVFFVSKSGFLFGEEGQPGTTHGSAYNYDSHIPVIFYGKNIPKGQSVRKVSITDIAPTVSMLLNISLPSGATGEPLIEIFE